MQLTLKSVWALKDQINPPNSWNDCSTTVIGGLCGIYQEKWFFNASWQCCSPGFSNIGNKNIKYQCLLSCFKFIT